MSLLNSAPLTPLAPESPFVKGDTVNTADAYASTKAALSATATNLADWIAKERAQSSAAGLWDDAAGMPTQKGLINSVQQYGGALVAGTAGPEAKGIQAFHGSPHDFDAFDASKIGTGEGAQAYGHGLYFAGNEAVAQGYRDALNSQVRNAAGPVDGAYVAAAKSFLDAGHGADETLAGLQTAYKDAPAGVLQEAVRQASTGGAGRMYEVQVNANPDHFLDWDKPLSEQSPHMQAALTPQGLGLKPFGPVGDKGYFGWADEAGNRVGPLRTGSPPDAIFDPRETGMGIAKGSGSWKPEQAAQALQQAGIPGIRYLDGNSRNAASFTITPPSQTVAGDWMVKSADYNSKGMHFATEADAKAALAAERAKATSNHVIFDPATIEIIRKYGLAGLISGAGAMADNNRQ